MHILLSVWYRIISMCVDVLLVTLVIHTLIVNLIPNHTLNVDQILNARVIKLVLIESVRIHA